MTTESAAFCCPNCQQPLQALQLAGHYHSRVDIDICRTCYLIWFENTESVKLAAPGVLDLVKLIHKAMQAQPADTLTSALTCPACRSLLKPVKTHTKFGRTLQLHCNNGHGYFQTFLLYLAEKGYMRPISWADLKQLSASGRKLYCAGCGAQMDQQPHDACPYCASSIGVLDPARLQAAIDIAQAAGAPPAALAAQAATEQMRCGYCGGSIDPTQDSNCPQCQAVVRRRPASLQSLQIEPMLEAKVRQNYQQQLPEVSRAKLQAVQSAQMKRIEAGNRFGQRWDLMQRKFLIGFGVLVAAIWIISMTSLRNRFHAQDSGKGKPAAVAKPPAPGAATIASASSAASAPVSNVAVNRLSPLPSVVPTPTPLHAADEPSFENMFSFPQLQCSEDAAQRQEVRIRQFTIATGNTPDEMRATYAQLWRARKQIDSGMSFVDVRSRYPDALPVDAQAEKQFLKKGAQAKDIERIAFCLGAGETSPVFRSVAGFSLVQVVEGR